MKNFSDSDGNAVIQSSKLHCLRDIVLFDAVLIE